MDSHGALSSLLTNRAEEKELHWRHPGGGPVLWLRWRAWREVVERFLLNIFQNNSPQKNYKSPCCTYQRCSAWQDGLGEGYPPAVGAFNRMMLTRLLGCC